MSDATPTHFDFGDDEGPVHIVVPVEERDALRAELEQAHQRITDLEAERDEARAELGRAFKVVQAAEALVDDWAADRSTHGGPLRAAVDTYRGDLT